MLLAAGFGTRLLPLTSVIPKPLIPVGGLPLIFYNLALLQHHGIKEVVINLHHLGKQIEKILGDGKTFGLKLEYSYEPKILGTGGGIYHAKPLLKNDSFLVLNADIIIDVNLKRLAQLHHRSKNKATLVVIESPLSKKFGVLGVNENQEVTSILSSSPKDEYTRSTSGRTEFHAKKNNPIIYDFSRHKKNRQTFFTGVHLLDPHFFKTHHKKKSFCIIRDYYIPLLQHQEKVGGFLYDGYWNDLGDLNRLQKTSQQFQHRKIKLSYQKTLNKFKTIWGLHFKTPLL